jgi:hypothetical protein
VRTYVWYRLVVFPIVIPPCASEGRTYQRLPPTLPGALANESELLAINPHTLRSRMRKLGIRWQAFRGAD